MTTPARPPHPLSAQAPRSVTPPDDLAELIGAVAERSDRVAFAGLFRHFAPRIKAYLMRGGLPAAAAEELAQEALVQVWRKAASFDPARARASTWVFTIARNLRIDQLRRAAGGPAGALEVGGYGGMGAGFDPFVTDVADDDRPDLASEAADDSPAPDEQLARARSERDLHAALAGLPQEQRDILRLSFFEEQPHAAIAQALAIPLGTVKSRIRLAVGHLRRQLGHLVP